MSHSLRRHARWDLGIGRWRPEWRDHVYIRPVDAPFISYSRPSSLTHSCGCSATFHSFQASCELCSTFPALHPAQVPLASWCPRAPSSVLCTGLPRPLSGSWQSCCICRYHDSQSSVQCVFADRLSSPAAAGLWGAWGPEVRNTQCHWDFSLRLLCFACKRSRTRPQNSRCLGAERPCMLGLSCVLYVEHSPKSILCFEDESDLAPGTTGV